MSANCQNSIAFNEARGNKPGVSLAFPRQIWSNKDNNSLIVNCASVKIINNGDGLKADDCLNGTILNASNFTQPFINFTQFWHLYDRSRNEIDPTQRFLPHQDSLTIYQSKRLYINVEGCVNTLRGECVQFVANYGRSGNNNTAPSRYQCYYNKVGISSSLSIIE